MIEKKILESARRCVESAVKKGARQAEVYLENGRTFSVTARDGEVETLEQSESMGMGLRLFVGQKLGFGYTTDFSSASVDGFVDRVFALGQVTAEDRFNRLPSQEALFPRTPSAETYDESVAELSPDWAVKISVEMEKICKGFDPRIKMVEDVGAGVYVSEVALLNSEGLEDRKPSTYIWLYAAPYAVADDGSAQVEFYSDTRCFKKELSSPEDVAREAARRVTKSLGAKKIPSGNMPIVLGPDMSKGFVRGLVGAVNGDMVFKKASFLADKLGQEIASNLLTVIDDPTLDHGVSSKHFDGEGMPARKLVIIEKGKLNLFLYDTYTAAKAGTKSTSSAARGYSSLPGIGSTNLFIEPGAETQERILGGVKYGLYVTKMMGQGVNTVTGDYSRGAKGFLIENGELTRPVQEVTVAGNMIAMLRSLDAVGNDLDWRGSTGAPTLRFSEMTVSGK